MNSTRDSAALARTPREPAQPPGEERQGGASGTRRTTLKLRPNASRRDPQSGAAGSIPVKSKGSRGLPAEARVETASDADAPRAYVSDRGHPARWSE
jgi:hypothetical protein